MLDITSSLSLDTSNVHRSCSSSLKDSHDECVGVNLEDTWGATMGGTEVMAYNTIYFVQLNKEQALAFKIPLRVCIE